MPVTLDLRNESRVKRLMRRGGLEALAQRIYEGEGHSGDAEVSLLFCDDAFMRQINQTYRGEKEATDVLSFPQSEPPQPEGPLGDIVISLETVEARCGGDREAMRREGRLLFCHGMLHLLGYDHGTPEERKVMEARQAAYLGAPGQPAWFGGEQGDGRR